MTNDELTRSQYLQGLLNQRKTLNQTGNSVVNPSISNDVDTLASIDTSFATTHKSPVSEADLNQIQQTEEKKDKNILGRIFGFVDEIAAKFGAGFVSAFEGGLDLGATILGAITGNDVFTDWAKQDIGTNASEWVKTYANFTPWGIVSNISNGNYGNREYWNSAWEGAKDLALSANFASTDLQNYREDANKYYTMNDELETGVGQFLGGAAQSIGMMLPSIMIGNAVGVGTGIANLGKAASLAMMGVGASGKGAEEAVNEGATAGQALGYGAAKGAVEVVSEIVVGKALGAASKGLGKLAQKAGLEKVAKTFMEGASTFGKNVNGVTFSKELIKKMTASKLVSTMVEEGAEEVFSDILAPVCEAIYKGNDAFKQYGDKDYYKQMAMSFASGAFVGGLTEGLQSVTNFARYGKTGVTLIENNQEYQSLLKEYNDAKISGKNTTEIENKIKTCVQDIIEALDYMNNNEKDKLKNLFDDVINADNLDNFKAELTKPIEEKFTDSINRALQGSGVNINIRWRDDNLFKKVDGKAPRAFYDPNTDSVVFNKKYASKVAELVKHEALYHAIIESDDSLVKYLTDVLESDKEISKEFHAKDEKLKKSYPNLNSKLLNGERIATFMEEQLKNEKAFAKIFSATSYSKSKVINLINRTIEKFKRVKGISSVDKAIVETAQRAIRELQNAKPKQTQAVVQKRGIAYSKKLVEDKEVKKSILNQQGGKYNDAEKLMPEIWKQKGVKRFIDAFAGTGTVAMNSGFDNVVMNDNNTNLYNIYNALATRKPTDVKNYIYDMIDKYNLRTREGFETFKNKYNETAVEKRNPIDLLILQKFSRYSQLQVDENGNFTGLFGNSKAFADKSETLSNIANSHQAFKNMTISNRDAIELIDEAEEGDLIYLDPPYANTNALYNRNWTEQDDLRMMEALDNAVNRGVKFVMSDVFSHNGKTNEAIKNWAKKYDVKHIERSYHGSTTDEVIISSREGAITNELRYSKDIDEITNKLADELSLDDLLFDFYNDFEPTSFDKAKLMDDAKRMKREAYEKLSDEEKRYLSFKKSYERNYPKLVQTLNKKLSPQQQEFFKNSALRSGKIMSYMLPDGLLIPMFHGTPNRYMYSWDSKRIGQRGTQRGYGYYLTSSLSNAESYSESYGKVIMAFVNITNPLSERKLTITKQQIKDFVRKYIDSTAREGTLSDYGDIAITPYEKILDKYVDGIFDLSENDYELFNTLYRNENDIGFDEFARAFEKEFGFDGYVAWNRAEGTIAVAFRPEQIKSIDNLNPTDSKDIRYSLEIDSDGNHLTEQQVNYFKDSKARDKKGNLVPVYHGTGSYGFNVFDEQFNDRFDGVIQHGFYFSNERSVAESYTNEGDYEDFEEYFDEEVLQNFNISYMGNREFYIDIGEVRENSDGFKELKKSLLKIIYENGFGDVAKYKKDFKILLKYKNKLYDLETLLKVNNKVIDEMIQNPKDVEYQFQISNDVIITFDDIFTEEDIEYYKEQFKKSGIYKTYLNLKDPFIIDAKNKPWDELRLWFDKVNYYTTRDIARIAYGQDYDGVIIKNVRDMGSYTGEEDISDVYIAFNSNQIKRTDNLNPTDIEDIRYSVDLDNEGYDNVKNVISVLESDDFKFDDLSGKGNYINDKLNDAIIYLDDIIENRKYEEARKLIEFDEKIIDLVPFNFKNDLVREFILTFKNAITPAKLDNEGNRLFRKDFEYEQNKEATREIAESGLYLQGEQWQDIEDSYGRKAIEGIKNGEISVIANNQNYRAYFRVIEKEYVQGEFINWSDITPEMADMIRENRIFNILTRFRVQKTSDDFLGKITQNEFDKNYQATVILQVGERITSMSNLLQVNRHERTHRLFTLQPTAIKNFTDKAFKFHSFYDMLRDITAKTYGDEVDIEISEFNKETLKTLIERYRGIFFEGDLYTRFPTYKLRDLYKTYYLLEEQICKLVEQDSDYVSRLLVRERNSLKNYINELYSEVEQNMNLTKPLRYSLEMGTRTDETVDSVETDNEELKKYITEKNFKGGSLYSLGQTIANNYRMDTENDYNVDENFTFKDLSMITTDETIIQELEKALSDFKDDFISKRQLLLALGKKISNQGFNVKDDFIYKNNKKVAKINISGLYNLTDSEGKKVATISSKFNEVEFEIEDKQATVTEDDNKAETTVVEELTGSPQDRVTSLKNSSYEARTKVELYDWMERKLGEDYIVKDDEIWLKGSKKPIKVGEFTTKRRLEEGRTNYVLNSFTTTATNKKGLRFEALLNKIKGKEYSGKNALANYILKTLGGSYTIENNKLLHSGEEVAEFKIDTNTISGKYYYGIETMDYVETAEQIEADKREYKDKETAKTKLGNKLEPIIAEAKTRTFANRKEVMNYVVNKLNNAEDFKGYSFTFSNQTIYADKIVEKAPKEVGYTYLERALSFTEGKKQLGEFVVEIKRNGTEKTGYTYEYEVTNAQQTNQKQKLNKTFKSKEETIKYILDNTTYIDYSIDDPKQVYGERFALIKVNKGKLLDYKLLDDFNYEVYNSIKRVQFETKEAERQLEKNKMTKLTEASEYVEEAAQETIIDNQNDILWKQIIKKGNYKLIKDAAIEKVTSLRNVYDAITAIRQMVRAVAPNVKFAESKALEVLRTATLYNLSASDQTSFIDETIKSIMESTTKVTGADDTGAIISADVTIRDFLDYNGKDSVEFEEGLRDSLKALIDVNAKPSDRAKELEKLANRIARLENLLNESREYKKIFFEAYRDVLKLQEELKYDNTSIIGDVKVNDADFLKKMVNRGWFTKRGNISGELRKHAKMLKDSGYFDKLRKSVIGEMLDETTVVDENGKPSIVTIIDFYEELADTYEVLNSRGTEKKVQKVLDLDETRKFTQVVSEIRHIYKQYKEGYYKKLEDKAKVGFETGRAVSSIIGESTATLKAKALDFSQKIMNPISVMRTATLNLGDLTKILVDDVENVYGLKRLAQANLTKEFNDIIDKTNIQKNETLKVSFRGYKIPKFNIYGLYLNLNADYNRADIEAQGFSITTDGKTIKHFDYDDELENDVLKLLSDEEIAELEKISDFFNGTLKEYAKKAGAVITPFFQVIEDRFYPVALSETAKGLYALNQEQDNFVTDASSLAHTKSRTGARKAIKIVNPFTFVTAYIDSFTNIASVVEVDGKEVVTSLHKLVKENERILNKKFKVNDSDMSIVDYISSYTPNFRTQYRSYMNKLMGKPVVNTQNGFLDTFAGRYSTAVLGLNVGSALTQVASLPTGMNLTGVKSSLKALLKGNTYNIAENHNWLIQHNGVYAWRVMEHGFVKGLTTSNRFNQYTQDVLNKVTEATLWGMEKLDQLWALLEFGFAQQHIADTMGDGYEVGSELNYEEANKLFTRVILETMSNSDPISKSMLRSGELGKLMQYTFGMFFSDAQQKGSLLIENLVLHYRNRVVAEQTEDMINKGDYKGLDEETVKKLNVEAKNNVSHYKTSTIRYVGTLIASGVLASLAKLLRDWLYGRKEPKDIINNPVEFLLDTTKETFISWLPFINQIVSYLDYGSINSMPLQTTLEIIDSIKSFIEAIKNGTSPNGAITDLVVQLAQFFGLPANNLKNIIFGILRNFAPEQAYKVENLLYARSSGYMINTFKSEIESGHKNKAQGLLKVYLDNFKVESSYKTVNELVSLYEDGYDVLPKNIPETYNNEKGETIKLTAEQTQAFRVAYNEAEKQVSLLLDTEDYKRSTQEDKSKIIQKIYNAYFGYAKAKALGTSGDTKLEKLLVATDGNINLATYLYYLNTLSKITETKNKSKKELSIEYINRIKVLNKKDKLVLMFLNGYSVKNESLDLLKSYLKQKGVSNKELKELVGE